MSFFFFLSSPRHRVTRMGPTASALSVCGLGTKRPARPGATPPRLGRGRWPRDREMKRTIQRSSLDLARKKSALYFPLDIAMQLGPRRWRTKFTATTFRAVSAGSRRRPDKAPRFSCRRCQFREAACIFFHDGPPSAPPRWLLHARRHPSLLGIPRSRGRLGPPFFFEDYKKKIKENDGKTFFVVSRM